MTENSIIPSEVGETTPVSWTPTRDITYEEWESIGYTFQQINVSINWWVGDWLNYGERKFGEMAPQAVAVTGNAIQTIMKYKAVAKHFLANERYDSLSWTHHFNAAYLPREERNLLMKIANKFQIGTGAVKEVSRLGPKFRARFFEMAEEADNAESILRIIEALKMDDDPYKRLDTSDEIAFSEDDFETFVGEHEEIIRIWDKYGVPIVTCGGSFAEWEPLGVKAELNEFGEPVLVWNVKARL